MQDIDRLIESNLGLVYAQLNKFNLLHDHEAESYAYEALYNATVSYTINKKTAFSTYATVCIYNALCNYLRQINRKRKLELISYNAVIDEEATQTTEFLDTLKVDNSVETLYLRKEHNKELWRILNDELNSMKESTKKSILLKWIESNCIISRTNLALLFGVSQPYVTSVIKNFQATIKRRSNK